MPELAVGIGLRAGVDTATILDAIAAVCGEARIFCLATVARRATEPGLLSAATTLGVGIVSFSAAELATVAVPHPSAHSLRTLGTPSVAEAAAILASAGGALVAPKRVVNGVVVAAASSDDRPFRVQ